MMYLLNSNLPANKPVLFSLTVIYGIGRSTSLKLCKKLGFSKNLLVKDLSENQINQLVYTIQKSDEILINKDLRKTKSLKIKRLIAMKSYRGRRLKQKLPVRGQRTHTNAKTAKK